MSVLIPVSELVKLPIRWIRADDKRINTVVKLLQFGSNINESIRLLNCGCEKPIFLKMVDIESQQLINCFKRQVMIRPFL